MLTVSRAMDNAENYTDDELIEYVAEDDHLISEIEFSAFNGHDWNKSMGGEHFDFDYSSVDSSNEFNHIDEIITCEEDDIVDPNNGNAATEEVYVEEVYSVVQRSNENNIVVAELITMYKCLLCNHVAATTMDFLEHFKQHVNKKVSFSNFNDDDLQLADEQFVCSICYSCFDTKNLVRDHMIKDHHLQEIKPNSAASEKHEDNNINYDYVDSQNIISTSSDSENDIDLKHIEQQTEIKENNSEQNIGKTVFLGPMSLNVLKSKLKRSFLYHCSIKGCLYKFESEKKKDFHMRCHITDSNGAVREFRCTECGTEHKKWRECTKHMWKHHKIDIDLLKCPLCDYKSIIAVKIFHHLQIHGTTKGYACSYCDEKFQQLSQLRSHSITHKKNDSSLQSRWYSQKTCELCQHVFANSKTLSKHIKTVHNKIKPFICNICGHKSARKNTWMIHMRQHTGAKPYMCKICPFRSADPTVCRIHERRHSQNKQYQCPKCSYASIQTISVKRHIKANHPEEFARIKCDFENCKFVAINPEGLLHHKMDHTSGLVKLNDDSCEAIEPSESNTSPKSLLKRNEKTTVIEKLVQSIEISSDCFLTVESTDSINHDLPVFDTGGVTIPAHSEDTQFSI